MARQDPATMDDDAIAMEIERLSNIELGGPREGSADIPRIADMM